MNVRVALSSSLRTPDAMDRLARIISAIDDGWHEWLGPDPDDIALAPYFTQYLRHRELLEKSYARALGYPLKSKRAIVIAEDADVDQPPPAMLSDETTLSLGAAAILLTQPLAILVENEINDGAFFKRLIEVVDHELVAFFHESRPRVRFENGGGNTVATAMVRHRAATARDAGLPLRLFVLVDSDARYPGHRDKATEKLREACTEAGASLLVLEKRAIENYVTDRALAEWAANDCNVAPSVAFICALTPAVRDHYPIKKGVPGKSGEPAVGTQIDPFDGPELDLPDGPEKVMYTDTVFPHDFCPKLSRAAERFVASTLVHSRGDLEGRRCLGEVEAIARTICGEL